MHLNLRVVLRLETRHWETLKDIWTAFSIFIRVVRADSDTLPKSLQLYERPISTGFRSSHLQGKGCSRTGKSVRKPAAAERTTPAGSGISGNGEQEQSHPPSAKCYGGQVLKAVAPAFQRNKSPILRLNRSAAVVSTHDAMGDGAELLRLATPGIVGSCHLSRAARRSLRTM